MARRKKRKVRKINKGWRIVKTFTIDEIREKILNNEIESERIKNLFILGFNCECCGKKGTHFSETVDGGGRIHLDLFSDDNYLMTVDHIIPISKGGNKTNTNNMQTLCMVCNETKGNNMNLKENETYEEYRKRMLSKSVNNRIVE